MGAGRDDRGVDLFAGAEGDAGDGPALHVDRGDFGVGEDRGSAGFGRPGDRHRDRSHSSDYLTPDAAHAVHLAEGVVEQVVSGAGRPRTGPDPDHAGRGDRALEPVVLEPVVEQVADRHREDPDQVVDVALAHAADPGTFAEDAGDVAGGLRTECGRFAEQHRPDEGGGTLEQFFEPRVRLGVLLRMLRDRFDGALDFVEEEDRPVLGHRRVGGVEGVGLVAEVLEAEVTDHLRLEHGDHVRAAGHPGAGPDLFRHAGAAEDAPSFEDQRLHAGLGQVGGRGQAVVSATDHDRVVALLNRAVAIRVRRGAGSGFGGCFHGPRISQSAIDYKVNQPEKAVDCAHDGRRKQRRQGRQRRNAEARETAPDAAFLGHDGVRRRRDDDHRDGARAFTSSTRTVTGSSTASRASTVPRSAIRTVTRSVPRPTSR